MPPVRNRVASAFAAMVLLALGVVLPMGVAERPVLIALLWSVIVALLVVLLLIATPLRLRAAAFLGRTQDDPEAGRIVRISELVNETDPVLRGRVFEGKIIVGPAVLMAGSADLQIETSSYRMANGSLYWEVNDDPLQRPQGAIILEACSFRHCEFRGIGWAMTKDDIARNRVTVPGT